MDTQILKRAEILRSIPDSAVARILRASEERKNFLIFSVSTEVSGDPETRSDRISRIEFCLANPDFRIIEGGHIGIERPGGTSKQGRSFPEAYEAIVSMYPECETAVCTYGLFDSWQLGAEIERFRSEITNPNPERFREAISVEYAAAALMGTKPGEDRSLRNVMERLNIKPFAGSFEKENNEIHTLCVLQRLFHKILL